MTTNPLITKEQKSTYDDHVVDFTNPHKVTASQINALSITGGGAQR